MLATYHVTLQRYVSCNGAKFPIGFESVSVQADSNNAARVAATDRADKMTAQRHAFHRVVCCSKESTQ